MAARSSSTAERSQPCNGGTSMIAAPSTAAPTSPWQLAQILDLPVEDSQLNVYRGEVEVSRLNSFEPTALVGLQKLFIGKAIDSLWANLSAYGTSCGSD